MLTGTFGVIYQWEDVQKELCDIMDISYDNFEEYQNVVGGEYKSLWLSWVRIVDVSMGAIQRVYFDTFNEEYCKEWEIYFIRAIKKLQEQLNGVDHILIEYS